jgi:Rrf2 family transcriptional regulator, nitric oxide-sensitive transcriptional repressor
LFSQTSEYALRAVVCLAERHGRLVKTQEIAEATQVPANYLSKVLLLLARAGFVNSERGIYGGHELKRPPAKLSILDIVNAVDPIQRIHACPLNLPEHAAKLCPLHRRLDNAMAAVQDLLAGASIEEMLVESKGKSSHCPFPAAARKPPRRR